jgi:hypothetical protein
MALLNILPLLVLVLLLLRQKAVMEQKIHRTRSLSAPKRPRRPKVVKAILLPPLVVPTLNYMQVHK